MSGLGDAEDRDEPVWPGDLDLGYQGFDEGLALIRGAVGDDLVDVVGDLGERGDVGGGGLLVDRGGKFRAAGTELLGLLA
ncbi:hypothetical protein [Saccharopolyspora rectivirgula]|uniref:hypothetical protein n=1 Tax=Saccharopolyspora rectivirgula TaxID=28042 RepID=UPI00240995F4|nr:hypothetical protein [Saccharopolyspora rectivirgula]